MNSYFSNHRQQRLILVSLVVALILLPLESRASLPVVVGSSSSGTIASLEVTSRLSVPNQNSSVMPKVAAARQSAALVTA